MRGEVVNPTLRVWLAVVVLGIASFTMVTTEFAPIGLLSQIALDLEKDRAAVGLAVTLYAWIGAVSGLLSAVLLPHIPRKPLLVALMLVLSATNLAMMAVHSLESLLLARAVGAVVHGFFWAMAAAVAAQIAPSRHMGIATTIVFGGISMASVIGVPLANLVGQVGGWRIAFGMIGTLGLLTAAVMLAVLPAISAGSAAGWRALATVCGRPDLRGIYIVTGFMAAANFAAYTFIEPFLADIPHVSPVTVAALLFGFGGAGFLGNILTGVFIDRFMKPVIALGLFALGLAFVGLGWFGPSLGTGWVLALLVVWGAAVAALFAGLQTWVLRAAGSAATPAAAVHSAVINAAIGIGASLGGRILPVSGVSGVMLAAGLVVFVPFALTVLQSAPLSEADEKMRTT